ncbi:MAG: type II toxin-antitoxin system RelE/ParE family toxin [Propionivibrio sp.]
MNANNVVTDSWSNPDSEALYRSDWPQEPNVARLYESGRQCGSCSYYAGFNTLFGLCCHPQSRHVLETLPEHFACPVQMDEGWGPHSFAASASEHCVCHGLEIIRNATSAEEARVTMSLLKILSIGNRQVDAFRITPVLTVIKRLREHDGVSMPRYDPFLTADAARDLDGIFRHIAEHDSLVAAERFLDRFEKTIVGLCSRPLRGGSFPNPDARTAPP